MFICVFLTSKKAPKFIHLPNSNNRAFDTIILFVLLELRCYTWLPFAHMTLKKTQKCRPTTENAQWKGHHRVLQDTQIPNGSQDYVLRFPNAEHTHTHTHTQKQRLDFSLGFRLELVWCQVLKDRLSRDYIENNSSTFFLMPLQKLGQHSCFKITLKRGIGWQGSEKQKYLNLSH